MFLSIVKQKAKTKPLPTGFSLQLCELCWYLKSLIEAVVRDALIYHKKNVVPQTQLTA